MFLRNSWYVLGWSKDVDARQGPVGRVVIGEPVVLWRDAEGALHAMEDRCPHRHAALSLGRVEGDTLRCQYHGMRFGPDGRCLSMPLVDKVPDLRIKTYPVVEKDSWIWVWMGDADRAEVDRIPDAWGIDAPGRPMRHNSIEYEAHYELINDNLLDLSHVDFVHETTLRVASGACWSQSAPRVRSVDGALHIERWFENARLPGDGGQMVDTWIRYEFHVPGIFILRGSRFPTGTAAACQGARPDGIAPIMENIEQQAVTPISPTRTAYHYATGLIGQGRASSEDLARRMDVVMATFEEDRQMIEAQQRIWNLTAQDTPRHFLPQDKAPFMMRQMMQRLIREEATTSR